MLKPILILILVLSMISCAAKKEPTTFEDSNAQAILEKIQLYDTTIKSLKGLAKVKIKTPDNKISYSQVTIAQKPDLLRIEALNPFGKTVGFISSDGDTIYIISQSQRATYNAYTEFDLASVYPGLNLKFSAENLVNLILGRLPENTYDMQSNPQVSVDGELIKLSFASQSSNSQNLLWVNGQNFRVEKAEFNLPQGQKATIAYEYFSDLVDGFYFPRTIDFSSEGLSISINYEDDVELNQVVNKSLFKPEV